MPWLFAALGLLLGFAIGIAAWLLWPDGDDALTQADVDDAVEQAIAATNDEPAVAAQAFGQIAPSIVVVQSWEPGVELGERDDEPARLGTGVVINDRGQILTADHIVANAGSIKLTFADGSSAGAKYVSADPDRDIAVLEADGPTPALVPATMGNPRTLAIGDTVFAVGNPLGLTGSLSSGVISGLERSIPFPGEEDRKLEDLIQFDAAVNQGNSGGPLLNDDGHVVGIVTALADPSQQGYFIGIGFAVPIDIAASGSAAGPSQ